MLGLVQARYGSCGKSVYGVSGSGTLGYVPLTYGRWGKSSSVSVSCVELWQGKAVRVRYGEFSYVDVRFVKAGHVRRKPIEAWFVVLGQLGLVEVGVLRLVGLRYGR